MILYERAGEGREGGRGLLLEGGLFLVEEVRVIQKRACPFLTSQKPVPRILSPWSSLGTFITDSLLNLRVG